MAVPKGRTAGQMGATVPMRTRMTVGSSMASRDEGAMSKDRLPPVHPGEILLHEFLEPMGLSRRALAKAIGVPAQRIGEIVHGRRSVTAETALRLGRYLGMDARFWLNLQTRNDLDVAEAALADRLSREVTPRAAKKSLLLCSPLALSM